MLMKTQINSCFVNVGDIPHTHVNVYKPEGKKLFYRYPHPMTEPRYAARAIFLTIRRTINPNKRLDFCRKKPKKKSL